jgi:predicted DNA-binding mobile mystery protein A
MKYWDKKLIREQLSAKLENLRALSSLPEHGWIKLIREALAMSTYELAQRTGIDQSRISRIENAEVNGDFKLSSMKKIAEGLNMKFVYGFIPKESLEEMTRQQARKIALKRMDKVNHTMRLEDQELDNKDKEKALEDMIQKILIDQPKDFWLQ